MNNQKGITLTSLAIYVIVMLIAIIVLSSIISEFYQNTNSLEADTEEILEFNNFNIYFLKEIKLKDNKLDRIDEDYILFASGNSFSFKNNKIYYNDIEICKNVNYITFNLDKTTNADGVEIDDTTVINVKIGFEKFQKTMKYKVEEIY